MNPNDELSNGERYDWAEPTRLRRNRRGTTFHEASCPRATNSVPWLWAEGRSFEQMRDALRSYDWLRPCKVCNPMGLADAVSGGAS